MKIFQCSACGQVVFFENVSCTSCGHALAFLPDRRIVSSLEPTDDAGRAAQGAADPASAEKFVALVQPARKPRYRLCKNGREHGVCNWAVPEDDPEPLCRACRLNNIIPNLSDPKAKGAWERCERAKRRLIYTLDALGLPLESRQQAPEHGLAFAFMADTPGQPKIYTGHADGLITINIAEADDPYRERTRAEMGEAYRTLLGHFRHESGHYYWDRLIRGSPQLDTFRDLFGDERADYAAAAQRHYKEGPPSEWPLSFVSGYASMHPWEDWAETWAHYLHIIDTLETARSYGLVLRPRPEGGAPEPPISARAVHLEQFDDVISAWVPVTVALNSLNRSMGLADLYPFVLSARAIQKLRFVHDVIEQSGARDSVPGAAPRAPLASA